VSVKADGDEAARVEQILNSQRGVDAMTRGQLYRESGWSRFDQDAQPYTREQIASERQRYGEDRSFARQDVRDDSLDAERERRTGGSSEVGGPIPGTDR
jgi:hypothetical protein